MKKYTNYPSLLIVLIMIFTGCDDSFLELSHPGRLTYDKFYTTEADFQASLNACYFSLKSQVNLLPAYNDLTTDNTFLNSYNATSDIYFFDSNNVPTNSSTIKNFWQAAYRTIMLANKVISEIGETDIPENTKKVFTGEAKFIRAYTYFNLVRIFGGVPKYDQEIKDINQFYTVPRSSKEEIYEFIISDLTDALTIDSDRTPQQLVSAKGKANSMAAKALLGKVYLQKLDYGNAATQLGGIISNGGSSLEPDLNKIYDAQQPFNGEIIFAVNYERVTGQNSPFTNWTLPKFSRNILPKVTSSDNGNGDYNIEPSLLAKFLPDDKRRKLIDSADIVQGSSTIRYYYSKKYLDLGTTSDGYSASDFIVLRYADVLLMYADALNQTNKTADAYPYINEVRNRAGLPDLPTGYNKDQMNNAISNERQLEFVLEGDRWFDLSFRGFAYLKNTLNSAAPHSYNQKTATIEDKEELFPIPADQVLLKPGVLIQNTGY